MQKNTQLVGKRDAELVISGKTVKIKAREQYWVSTTQFYTNYTNCVELSRRGQRNMYKFTLEQVQQYFIVKKWGK